MTIKKIFQSYLKNSSGASAVEFALVAPILILLIIGTVDMGRFITQRMQVQNMTHAVAQYVAKKQNDTDAQTVAQASYRGDFADVTVQTEFVCTCADGIDDICPLTCANEGDYQRRFVSVSTTGNFEPMLPYPGLPDSFELTRVVRMRVD